MGLCHPKPSAPKKAPPDDGSPPVYAPIAAHGPAPPTTLREGMIDDDHHRRLVAIATAAAGLVDEGKYYRPVCGRPSHEALHLLGDATAIARARGMDHPVMDATFLPSALAEMSIRKAAGDSARDVVDAVLGILCV